MIYPDTLPFKLRALRSLTDIIKEVTPANGYVYDLSDFDPGDGDGSKARVYRGRAWFGDGDPLPMVSVLEGTAPGEIVAEPPVEAVGGEYDWQLILQGFVEDDADNPTDPAYLMLADVRRRLAQERKRRTNGELDPLGLGQTGRNRITALRFGPGVVRPADDISAKAWWWMAVTLRIFDNAEQPYT